jgi:hypothetical protein
MTSNRRISCIRQWSTGAGLAAAAAAMIGMGTAHADTPDDVLGQAVSDLNQGTALLDTASTTDLSARSAELITGQEGLIPQLDPDLTQLATLQDTLSAGDQTLVADADEQVVSASLNILSADQAVVTADQAGDLSGSGLNATDLTVIGADLNFLGAFLDADGATILAALTGGLDTSSAADLASSLDPATAVDPSIFADALSSLGL